MLEAIILSFVIQTLTGLNFWSIIFRILLAVLMGGGIGLERGRHGRAAGLRTHTLVCLGTTMTVVLGMYTIQELGLGGDILRISAQVVSGIGFLGAGAILTRNHTHVTGLTTAAGLWATACLGLGIGVGLYSATIVGWVVIMIALTVFTRLERGVKRIPSKTYYLELNDIARVNELSREMGDAAVSLQVVCPRSGKVAHIGIELVIRDCEHFEQLMEHLRNLPYVVIAIPVTASLI